MLVYLRLNDDQLEAGIVLTHDCMGMVDSSSRSPQITSMSTAADLGVLRTPDFVTNKA
jgi:hypothetical protein